MEFLGLHIFHLDIGEKCDNVINLLKKDIGEIWEIKKPTEETNAIYVPINIKNIKCESGKLLEEKLKKSIKLLKSIRKTTIDKIKKFDLDVAMRVHTNKFYLSLSPEFVKECGRLGFEIDIMNTKLLNEGNK